MLNNGINQSIHTIRFASVDAQFPVVTWHACWTPGG
jgi:hypothetical protein